MPGVDFGELAAQKMMIFERLFWFFPRALFAARFGFLRYFFHLVFWVVGPRAQTGQMRKLTHSPCEHLFFQGTRRRRARHREGNRRPKTAAKVDATKPLAKPQDNPKSRPKGRKSRPHAVSEWPGRPPGANLAPKSPSEAFRMPFWPSRGSILASAGVDFGGRPRPAQERPGSFGESMLGQC